MARARNVKPGLFKNELLAEIEPMGRLLFIGLWTLADRDGRLEDRPKRIKGELFPYDNCEADSLLSELAKHGFILRYEVAGNKYIQIVNFKKHQNPHIKESESTIPAPGQHHTGHADSLIPDSLNPITAMSGLPPDAPPLNGKKPNGVTHDALQVLEFLNEKTGRKFRGLDGNGKPTANLSLVIQRLKTGVSVQDCKTVIARKYRDWAQDDKMWPYLRPETLFGARKFEQYLGECTTEERRTLD